MLTHSQHFLSPFFSFTHGSTQRPRSQACTLLLALFRVISTFLFFLLFLHSFLFVRRSERLYIFTGILLVVVYSPPSRGNVSSSHHLYLFLFLLLPFPFLFHFVLFVSFKHRQVRYRITIVINFFLFCLLLIWSSNRTSSNPCVLAETRLDYEFRFTYTCCLCVCLPLCLCMRVFVRVCVCVSGVTNDTSDGLPACARNHRTLSSYSLIDEKNARRYVVNSLIYKKYVWGGGGIDEILRWLSHHFSGASDQLDDERHNDSRLPARSKPPYLREPLSIIA